jgi:hypothetical protein
MLSHPQFIKTISDKSFLTRPGSAITQGVGARGGGMMATIVSSDTSKQTAEFRMMSAETLCWDIERK